ncbi:hypothetical protein [Kordiimonas sp.]|uniref:hypothetical protein n=1 Tax=Kordiimonas sp. TaxID=1970157 RepID=UPI003A8EFA02
MQATALKFVASAKPTTMATPPTTPATSTGPDRLEPVRPVKPVVKPVIPPANDPFMGLISGTAPDPASEIPTGPDPVRPVEAESEATWQPKVLDLDSAREETGPKYLDMDARTGTVTVSNMAEAEFVEWWAIDVWDAIAAIGGFIPALNLDLSELRTKEEDYEQARTAAKHLYKIALRNPRMLGWMIADSTVALGDGIFCLAFFGGKALAIIAVIMEKKREWAEKKKAKKDPFRDQSNRSEPVQAKGGAHG